MEADYSAHDKSLWKEVIPHNSKVFLEDLDVNAKYLILSERENGLQQLDLVNRADLTSRRLQFADPSYEVGNVSLPDYKSAYMRFSYESLAQPRAIYDEEFASHKRVLRKERVVAGYDKTKYEVKRIWATAPDGAQVPISILKKKATKLDGKSPALVYSYGSYGISNDVYFRGSILSLIDRGFVYALPHIRGGSEMGRDWYEQGRLNHKINTFTDFIAATEKLIADGYTSKGHVYAEGGSAGGLLMGAVVNMRPDLYKGIVAEVPFVDVLTTMLDDTIPLTSGEYSQWGDPHDKDAYFYMKRYSPYDNVEKKAYPAIYVSTGYHDSQVQYWEPAKWVAKLREMKTDKNPLLLYTDFSAGHGGASGRYESIKTIAKPFTFILMVEGIKE
jgi:oligopeptidase B